MSPAALQQSVQYATALSSMGATVNWQLDVLTIQRRVPGLGHVTYVPRGELSDLNGIAIVNAPDPSRDQDHRAAGHIPLMTPQTLAILDLKPNAPDRLAAQHGKWRNRLRRGQKAALNVSFGRFHPARHSWLLAHETLQRSTQRYTALPHSFVCAYPAKDTLLIQAMHQRQPVAAMLFLLHAPAATYHIGWVNAEGRRLNAHPRLLWEAGQILRARGYMQIDLGTLDTQNAPGLARFKLGSGAKPHQLGHTWLHLPVVSPLLRTFRRRDGFPSGLLS